MNISYNWLKELIDFDYSPNELSDILTATGLEVAGVEEKGGVEGNLAGVVVGKVLTAEQHPNADRLRVCTVDVGEAEPLHIVCGAPNVAAGQYVPVATVGTTLYPFEGEAFKIKKGKIRGEVSMGMICAEDEIGIGPEHDGILILEGSPKVGTPCAEVIKLDKDFIIEIELTPNRIDGASHYGVARDLAAFMRQKPQIPALDRASLGLSGKNPIPVTIEDPSRCKRYTSLYIKDVTVKESPDWLKKRLVAIGLRPINNVVDITNYVLMELGQPMHAFDADQLAGGEIIVKTLDSPTKFVTLDEIERELLPGEDLMICDAEKPLCIGGTMGGINSGVTFETKNVFLEAAYFDPTTVRKSAKRLGIHSDSSFRFERGADPYMTETAALRATQLILELAGGSASEVADVKLDEFAPFPIELSVAHTQRLIGKELAREEIIEILRSLEIEVKEQDDSDKLSLLVPPYRVDVQRPQDAIEEVLRIYGYNNVDPASAIRASVDYIPKQDLFGLRSRFCDHLSASGYYEILTNSLVNKSLGNDKAVNMVNPLSEDQSMLRQSMLPGALESVQHNQNRQNEDLAFYEVGRTYQKKQDAYVEKEWITITLSGQKHDTHWAAKNPMNTLFTLGREVERIQKWFRFEGKRRELDHPEFDYGLELLHQGSPTLHYGKISAAVTEAYDLRNEVFFMQIDWEKLVNIYVSDTITFAPIPIYPSIRRDISMLIDNSTSFDQIQELIFKANPKLIKSVDLYDVYKGKGIDADKKSYLVSFLLRDERKSLASEVADKVVSRVYQVLEKELGVEIRK